MGLYLCVFREDEELCGVEVGSYKDFEGFRDEARARDRPVLRRYPTLLASVKANTVWSWREAGRLARELAELGEALSREPARPFTPGTWQEEVARARRLDARSLRECYIDVQGEPLVDGLLELCRISIEGRLPILFQ